MPWSKLSPEEQSKINAQLVQETLVEVESPEEALSASLNLYGGVNLPYMESLCDLPQAEMLEALKGRVF